MAEIVNVPENMSAESINTLKNNINNENVRRKNPAQAITTEINRGQAIRASIVEEFAKPLIVVNPAGLITIVPNDKVERNADIYYKISGVELNGATRPYADQLYFRSISATNSSRNDSIKINFEYLVNDEIEFNYEFLPLGTLTTSISVQVGTGSRQTIKPQQGLLTGVAKATNKSIVFKLTVPTNMQYMLRLSCKTAGGADGGNVFRNYDTRVAIMSNINVQLWNNISSHAGCAASCSGLCTGCTGTCSSSCSGGCSGGCLNGCSSCTGSCSSACGGCDGSCDDGCGQGYA